jgi:hypothetical protein
MTKPQAKKFYEITDLTNLEITLPKKFSLAEEIIKHEKDPKNPVILQQFKTNNISFRIALRGELFTDGIIYSADYKTHSIGFKFTDEDQVDPFIERIHSIFDPIDELSSWEQRDLLKNDNQIWLKLKPEKSNTAYAVKSNVKLHPKKTHDAPLHSGDQIIAIIELHAYFALESQTYGITPKVREIIVGEDAVNAIEI